MDKEKIQKAIISALLLLNNEVENIEFEDLKKDYLTVIGNLERALNEFQ
ncbi:hypothetical protein [Chryseobacterium sp.]|nr:hypothetical protein [Chryseobacterium sp.]